MRKNKKCNPQIIDITLKKILILLTITLLLVACSSDSDPSSTNGGRRVPLQVTGYIADTPLGITRAVGSAWETGDKIGLYALPHDNTTTPIEGGSNVGYVLTGSPGETNGTIYKVFTSISTSITLPATGTIDVYGYYPYSDGATTPTEVAVDVRTQTEQKSIDLMTTGKVSTTTQNGSIPINMAAPSCQLLFHHRLTKLVFNLQNGEDFSDSDIAGATALTIGSQRTSATYNIYTDLLTCSGEASQSVSAVVGATTSTFDKTFEAIVLPNNATNPAVDRRVTIVVQGRSYTFTIGKATSFVAGHKYIYNVTVYPFSIIVNPEKYTEQW